ncbi:DUF2794 domain-containing protein [Rhodospirillaceae bacterium SYSU D60014]|uniref:DUF2794 domain-containing protein n=1 Tax=Virgifigura deserti TaxID=2268457 RepID=UPI000E65F64E
MTKVIRLADLKRRHRDIFFNRRELNQLLSLYSRRVARGEWRDYAIDHKPGMAVFSVFRHSHERPLYSIVKCTTGPDRPPDYVVLTGQKRLKLSKSIDDALKVLDIQLRVVS